VRGDKKKLLATNIIISESLVLLKKIMQNLSGARGRFCIVSGNMGFSRAESDMVQVKAVGRASLPAIF